MCIPDVTFTQKGSGSLCLEYLWRPTYEMLIRRRRERGVAYRPGTCQHVSVRGSSGEEEAQCAVVWMQCQWKRKTYEGLLNWGYVRSDTEYRCWLWRERSWCNMNWLRVRNIKWEDGTHVLRARRRMKRKLTKWRISTIVCSSSTNKFVGVWEISRS